MLTIYFDGDLPDGADVINNPEAEFLATHLLVDEVSKKLVQYIDKGTLQDSSTFIDRFGRVLPTLSLSTGCKCALLVNSTDKVVNLRECGVNARDSIISFCKHGFVLLSIPEIPISKCGVKDIDVSVDGKNFVDIENLIDYLSGGYTC